MFSQEEKLVYRLHFSKIQHLIKESLKIIQSFLQDYPHSHISVSWGKDSTVMLDLCHQIYPQLDIVWIDRGEGGDVPEVYKLVDLYRKNNYRIRQIMTPYSILDLHRQYSLEEIEQKKLITKMLKKTCNKLNAEYDGFFWGIRAQESTGRKMFAKCYKEIFMRTTQVATCSPMLWWTARDIWSYLCMKQIPYNHFYDIVAQKPFEREKIRYSNYAGLVGIGDGRIVEIRRFYPKLYQQMVEVQPSLRNFA